MRILIAEDDRIIGDGLNRSLRQTGYAVDWVTNGIDADNALTTGTYDLVILDIGLPRMSGLDVLRRLRARKLNVPVPVSYTHLDVYKRQKMLKAKRWPPWWSTTFAAS